MALGSLTEMSIGNFPGGKRRQVCKTGAYCLQNVGASTSHNPIGLHRLLQGKLYIFTLPKRYSIVDDCLCSRAPLP
jgi:hypothetical protein